MECSLTEILDYELVIEDKIGFNFEAFVIIYNDVDDYNHDQLRRHIEKISNDKIRMKNQLSRKYDEKLYLFNNCHNMNIYIKTIHLVIEKCDLNTLLSDVLKIIIDIDKKKMKQIPYNIVSPVVRGGFPLAVILKKKLSNDESAPF